MRGRTVYIVYILRPVDTLPSVVRAIGPELSTERQIYRESSASSDACKSQLLVFCLRRAATRREEQKRARDMKQPLCGFLQ